MKIEDIKEGMTVVCREKHTEGRLFWDEEEMDNLVGRPLIAFCVEKDAWTEVLAYSAEDYPDFDPDKDEFYGFLAEWLEPWKGEKK